MSQPFVGEIRMFGGNFAPSGWAFCDGQSIAISQNSTLFNLIGTTYGGNGTTTFNLPDLRGRRGVHQGTGSGLSTYVIGESGGTENRDVDGDATCRPYPRRDGGDREGHGERPERQHVRAVVRRPIRSGQHRIACRPVAVGDGCRGRQPAPRESVAVSRGLLHHLVVRHLPIAELSAGKEGTKSGHSIPR